MTAKILRTSAISLKYFVNSVLMLFPRCAYRGDLVTMRDIAFVHKKQKLDKEGRMQTIKVTIDSYNVYTCAPPHSSEISKCSV